MEKFYVNGAEITKVKNKFYIIGHQDKQEIKDFIAKKFGLKEFLCIWLEVEETKIINGWLYRNFKIS